LDRLKNLEEKINNAVEKVRTLKEEKLVFEKRIRDLEAMLEARNLEVDELKAEKSSIAGQIQELLSELDTIEG